MAGMSEDEGAISLMFHEAPYPQTDAHEIGNWPGRWHTTS